jgi:hypothetical protein
MNEFMKMYFLLCLVFSIMTSTLPGIAWATTYTCTTTEKAETTIKLTVNSSTSLTIQEGLGSNDPGTAQVAFSSQLGNFSFFKGFYKPLAVSGHSVGYLVETGLLNPASGTATTGRILAATLYRS